MSHRKMVLLTLSMIGVTELAACASGGEVESPDAADPPREDGGGPLSSTPPVAWEERGGAMGHTSSFSTYVPTGERLVTTGFDPGLSHAKALSVHSGARWICPVGEPCAPQAPATGYYNLVQDRAGSDVSTDTHTAVFSEGVNAGLPGLTRFRWLRDASGGAIADLLLGNTHLRDWRAPGAASPYSGLQYTVASGGFPGGLRIEDTIPFGAIRYIHLRMRARVCVPPGEPYASGRLISYAGMHSHTRTRPNGASGAELAMNLLRFVIAPDGRWPDGGIAEPGRSRWECAYMNQFSHPTCASGAIDIDGPSWGLSRATDLVVTRSSDCRADMEGLESQPYVDYVIDVPRALARLIAERQFDQAFVESAVYSGGILTGFEIFGPATGRVQLDSYTIYRAESPMPLGDVMRIMRAGLSAADPGFLADVDRLVRRRTLTLTPERCATADCVCPPIGAACEYGTYCSTGTRLRMCTNGPDGISAVWFDMGSALPCSADMTVGSSCAAGSPTCLDGPHIVACNSAPYTGPLHPPHGAGTRLGPGNYRFVGAPERPKFAVDATGWCWFAMRVPPGAPVVDTDVDPHSLGLVSRDRCTWDPPAGNYRYRPGRQTFYYDGAGGWCWFDRVPAAGLPIVETDTLPQAMGEMITSRGGRCSWDG